MTEPLTLLSRAGTPRWVDPLTMEERAAHPSLSEGMTRPELWLYPKDDTRPAVLWGAGSDDVYELLTDFGSFARSTPEWAGLFAGAVLFTSGWAAPLPEGATEPDTAPSQHAERRRVFLAVCVTAGGTASRLMFPDRCEIVDDPGTATGSLADAVAEALRPMLSAVAE